MKVGVNVYYTYANDRVMLRILEDESEIRLLPNNCHRNVYGENYCKT